ncbi:unnamed protein product [Caenorhabditis auriculariae]|uniref:Fibronectin type-III domain-containing protein n=1 Tax=Caenorhabditis auriculariae TaxID=2777116 RepID=A0A8S1HU59_9PELO|nr:unnamed protein product [Caenorhabditis auriculariae]
MLAVGWPTVLGQQRVPSAPQNFHVELTSATSVKITWDPPKFLNGEVLGYQMRKTVVDSPGKERIYNQKDLQKRYFIIDNLDPNTKYSFNMNAFNRYGDGEYTERKFVTTQGIPPEAPEIVSVSLERDEPPIVARIEWKLRRTRPNEGPIERYKLWLKPRNSTETYTLMKVVAGTEMSTDVSGLWMGVVYDVFLGAENKEGLSANATETLATPIGSPDGEPLDVQYEILKGKIIVSWRPPAEEKRNGNISFYKAVLTSMDSSGDRLEKTVTPPAKSAVFEVNVRRAYTFKVAASTMKGLGPFSPVLTINPDPAG